jgi:RNA recognition motif-containing protein
VTNSRARITPLLPKGVNINIFVGNLSLKVTEEELRQEFAAFGEVSSVAIMNDKYIGSGQSKGYGFVEMPSLSEGEAVINGLNGKILRHSSMEVIRALPLSDKGHNGSYGYKRDPWYKNRARQRV